MLKKFFQQRGQAMVLYALMVPMLFTFVGVAADFGWWYFNESKLQNAADAAVLAGANYIDDKGKVELISSDDENFREFIKNKTPTPPNNTVDTVAKDMANENLTAEYQLNNVLYKSEDSSDPLYYIVKLTSKADHLFSIMEQFGDMNTKALAVAKISIKQEYDPSGEPVPDDVPVILEELRTENVIIGNWELQNYYKDHLQEFKNRFGYDLYVGAWNHFQDPYNHSNNEVSKISTNIRKETINIFDDVKTDESGNVISFGDNKSSVVATKANINNDKNSAAYNPKIAGSSEANPYTWDKLDSINIDFRPDVSFKADSDYIKEGKDWDLNYGYLDGASYINTSWGGSKYVLNRGTLRIHSSINFGAPYKVRSEDKYPDVLWARIESEPMISNPYKTSGLSNITGLNSVRQLIINVNGDNTIKGDDGKYLYRPVVIFYDGPERYNTEDKTRESQPVILNLNTPFRGILYMPNSPVVIVGNENNFQGFIVAKSYKRLKTTEDFEEELETNNGTYTRSGDDFEKTTEEKNPYHVEDTSRYTSGKYSEEPAMIKWKYTKITEDGIDMYVDNYGNVQYMTLETPVAKYGKYDNFEIEGFSNYSSSSENLFVSKSN